MENQLQTTGIKDLANQTSRAEGPLSSDLVIPYLLLSQASSDLVKERKSQIGDFCRSTNGEKLGGPEAPVEIILLGKAKTFWRIDQQVPNSDKWKFLKTLPRGAHNEVMEFKFWGDKDGVEVANNVRDTVPGGALLHRRYKQFRLFGILPADIQAEKEERAKLERGEFPDVSKALTPVIISLQSTSGYPCGKDIETFTTKASSFGMPLWKFVLQFTCNLEQKGDDTFYQWKLIGTNPPKPVAKEDLAVVQKWAELVSTRGDTLKTDESAENQVGEGGNVNAASQERVAEVC